jgi:hypothetical protein
MVLLNEFFCLEHDNRDYDLIARRMYKHTSCGAWISIDDGGISIGSIVEGCNFGTATYRIGWPELTADLLSQCIEAVEVEADDLWTWANDTDAECDAPDTYSDFSHLPQDGRSS